MQSERLVDQQIRVEVVSCDGVATVRLSDGQQFTWPLSTETPNETYYLTLSSGPVLPTKNELANLVLQEILKLDQ